jgi:hypothetical protein
MLGAFEIGWFWLGLLYIMVRYRFSTGFVWIAQNPIRERFSHADGIKN